VPERRVEVVDRASLQLLLANIQVGEKRLVTILIVALRLSVAAAAFFIPDWKILFRLFACLHLATPILVKVLLKESPR